MSIFDTPAAPAPGDNGASVVTDMPGVEDAAAMPALGDEPAGDAPVAGEPVPPSYLDVDQYGNHLVKLKVDGEDRELPFSQVREGLMMREDYTRKTQALAEERRRLAHAAALADALDQSPEQTLKQLSQAYDLDPATDFQRVQRDPDEQRLIDMQRQLASQQQQFAQQRIENEINALKANYGDFDVQRTAAYAAQNRMDLTSAYKAMQFDELRAQQQKQQDNDRRRQAAAAAAGTTHSGGGTQAGAVAANSKPAQSIREAYQMALKSHGN